MGFQLKSRYLVRNVRYQMKSLLNLSFGMQYALRWTLVLLFSHTLIYAHNPHEIQTEDGGRIALKVTDASKLEYDQDGKLVQRAPVNEYWSYGSWDRGDGLPGMFGYELTTDFTIDPDTSPIGCYLLVYSPGSYELFFDQQLIGTNGKLGRTGDLFKELAPGPYRRTFQIPHALLTTGSHKLVLKGVRSQQILHSKETLLKFQSLQQLLTNERWNTITYGSYLVYIIFGFYFLVTFFIKRNNLLHLYVGLLCLLFSSYALSKLAYHLLDLDYPQVAMVIQGVICINYILCVFSHLSVFEALKFPRKIAWATLPVPFVVSLLISGLASYETLKTTFEWLIVIAVLGVIRRKKHSVSALIILTALTVVYTMRFFEKQQLVIYALLLVYLLFSICLAAFRQYKDEKEAVITNTRLNLELIKNKIQPHFVLNSITSAMEWIESDPPQGVKFLNALAKEFELLSSISEKKLIPLAMELESCRNYLKVMEFRKKSHYELITEGVTPRYTLPPSIIRNLLENAITHNSFGQRPVRFHLTEVIEKNKRIYEFRSPCEKPACEKLEEIQEGTGIRYIKARLMESYDRKWRFSHGPDNGDWVTRIEVLAS